MVRVSVCMCVRIIVGEREPVDLPRDSVVKTTSLAPLVLRGDKGDFLVVLSGQILSSLSVNPFLKVFFKSKEEQRLRRRKRHSKCEIGYMVGDYGILLVWHQWCLAS
ncbi:hypothetical protein XENOCAPTIV_003099 [Xenoophorus captivus]|uniref:Uncharacterized protein n=1 Tax=Xenoophorus captivus TaxID=1517983 RepID=A0ABV0SCS6_9TELE